jgi:hypothetical protein
MRQPDFGSQIASPPFVGCPAVTHCRPSEAGRAELKGHQASRRFPIPRWMCAVPDIATHGGWALAQDAGQRRLPTSISSRRRSVPSSSSRFEGIEPRTRFGVCGAHGRQPRPYRRSTPPPHRSGRTAPWPDEAPSLRNGELSRATRLSALHMEPAREDGYPGSPPQFIRNTILSWTF